jgi:hypothetical protein
MSLPGEEKSRKKLVTFMVNTYDDGLMKFKQHTCYIVSFIKFSRDNTIGLVIWSWAHFYIKPSRFIMPSLTGVLFLKEMAPCRSHPLKSYSFKKYSFNDISFWV